MTTTKKDFLKNKSLTNSPRTFDFPEWCPVCYPVVRGNILRCVQSPGASWTHPRGLPSGLWRVGRNCRRRHSARNPIASHTHCKKRGPHSFQWEAKRKKKKRNKIRKKITLGRWYEYTVVFAVPLVELWACIVCWSSLPLSLMALHFWVIFLDFRLSVGFQNPQGRNSFSDKDNSETVYRSPGMNKPN